MQRRICSFITIAVLLFIAWPAVWADRMGLEDQLSDVSPGIEPTTMGGAFVAVADDVSTVYWNPAGLSRVGNSALAFHITFAGQNLDKARDAGDLIDLIDPDDFDYEDAKRLVDKMKGAYGATLAPQFALYSHGWALSVTTFGLARARLSEPAANQVRIQGKAAVFASGALSHGWKANEKLRLGASLRYIYGRAVAANYVGDSQGNIVVRTDPTLEPNKRMVTFDAGALYEANEHVTYGATLRNITNPTFFGKGAKTKLATTLDVGAAYRRGGLTLAADLHNLLGFSPRPDPSLHLGARYQFPAVLSVQVGLYDGDPTVGAGLDLGPLYIAAGLGEDIERMVTAGLQAQW